jgi:hypothetical protein
MPNPAMPCCDIPMCSPECNIQCTCMTAWEPTLHICRYRGQGPLPHWAGRFPPLHPQLVRQHLHVAESGPLLPLALPQKSGQLAWLVQLHWLHPSATRPLPRSPVWAGTRSCQCMQQPPLSVPHSRMCGPTAKHHLGSLLVEVACQLKMSMSYNKAYSFLPETGSPDVHKSPLFYK